MGEYLRIARATLLLSDFEPKAIDLVQRMINQGGDRRGVEKFLLKIIKRHPESFSQFRIKPEDLIPKMLSISFPFFIYYSGRPLLPLSQNQKKLRIKR